MKSGNVLETPYPGIPQSAAAQWALTLSFAFLALGSNAQAIDSKNPCNHMGETLSRFSKDQNRVAGSTTGGYVREVFSGKHAGIRSCFEISTYNAPLFTDGRYNETQAPLAYFIAKTSVGAFEGGVEFEETTHTFRMFKKIGSSEISYHPMIDVYPGSQICMSLYLTQGQGIFLNVDSLNGKSVPQYPFGFGGNFEAKAPMGRVMGFATRDSQSHENGFFTQSRLNEIKNSGFFFHAAWSGGELLDLGPQFSSTPIPPTYSDYIYSSSGQCSLTTVWPKAIINIQRSQSRLIFWFFPGNSQG